MKGFSKKYAGTVVITLLLMTALILLFSRKCGTLSTQEIYFSPQKISSFDRILISQGKDSLLLERSDKKWILNTSTIARNDRIGMLMESLARIEIVSPVAKRAEEHILELLHEKAKRVQLYIRGNLENDFHMVYDSTMIKGTYIMPEQSGDIFMVRLKGYPGDNIENIFTLDYRSWQNNILFDLGPDEIQEVSVQYPDAVKESYRIFRNKAGDILLSDMSETIPEESTDLQEIMDYLFFFSNIRFEYPEEYISDSVLSGMPFVEFRLISNTKLETDLKGYRLWTSGEFSEINISHFIGLINHDRDTVILDYQDLDPIFRRLDDFQKK